MTVRRAGSPRMFQGLWAACLIATGLFSIACARGPTPWSPGRGMGPPMEMHRSFLERARKGHVDLLFLGDSITQGWNDNAVWKRFYGPRNAANFGIGGDRTQHVLWRIQNGELDGIEPKVVVLMIGTNNADSATADEIAQGVTAIVEELRRPPARRRRSSSSASSPAERSQTRSARSSSAVNAKIATSRRRLARQVPGHRQGVPQRGRDHLAGDHAGLPAPEQQGLPDLGRRHGADPLVDARRAAVSGRSQHRRRGRLTNRTGPTA